MYKLKNKNRFYLFLIIIIAFVTVLALTTKVNSKQETEFEEYIVTVEDKTLWDIVLKEYDTNKNDIRKIVWEIKQENGTDIIRHGQVLKIPIKKDLVCKPNPTR